MRYAEIRPNGKVKAWLETHSKIIDPSMIETELGEEVVGMKWDGATFQPDALTAKEKAAKRLEQIDNETGMNRLMRETLAAIAGAAVPATLKAAEDEAALERAKLAA